MPKRNEGKLLKAKSRLVPDIMVAATECRTESFHPWKSLCKE